MKKNDGFWYFMFGIFVAGFLAISSNFFGGYIRDVLVLLAGFALGSGWGILVYKSD